MLISIFRFILVLLGGFAGYQIGKAYHLLIIPGKAPLIGIINYIIDILFGAALGYVSGGIVGRRAVKLINWVESLVSKISLSELLVGLLGLIVGLIISAIIYIPLSGFQPIGPYISIVIFVIVSYLFIRIGVKRHEDFSRLLGLARTGSILSSSLKILDTSTIIDGRILDISLTSFIEGKLIIPRFVLYELQGIADSADPIKRNRGRRGLEVLSALQKSDFIDIEINDVDFPNVGAVDSKLIKLAQAIGAVIMTNDYNLNKVAELQGVKVLNINELSNALKPVVLPGEELTVTVVKEGKEANQGVAYLDDGTMVVIEHGRSFINNEIKVEVTSILQTPAGRMVFGRLASEARAS